MASGGTYASNLGQGRRAEYLAQFILSRFGPCDRVAQENDYGIDLLAALARPKGSVSDTSLVYAVQVKTGRAKFKYSGPQLQDWLSSYNLPILLGRVDKARSSIKLHSTWLLNHLVLLAEPGTIRSVEFREEYGTPDRLKEPEISSDGTAIVWVGPPALVIALTDVADGTDVERLRETLIEWVHFDAKNYFRRLSGITRLQGYVQWKANEIDGAIYWHPYVYGPKSTGMALQNIQECATLVALANKGDVSVPVVAALREFVKSYGLDPSEFTKQVLKL
jgi:hypothetical protein